MLKIIICIHIIRLVATNTLSKQIQLMLPETLIALVLIQKIWWFFNLDWAYNFPTVITAGRAGGMTIVIMSKALAAVFRADIPLKLYKQKNELKI